MKFTIACDSRTGYIHETQGLENQDAYCCGQERGKCCLCLADGAGSKSMSGVGAARIAREICRVLLGQFETLLTMAEEEIAAFLTDRIQHWLSRTAEEYRVPIRELGSTLLFAVTDGSQYLTGHLGDGVILCERERCWNVLSYPQNGSTPRSTCLTTMSDIGRYLRIRKEECGDIRSLYLLTDGMMYAMFEPNFQLKFPEPLSSALDRAMQQNTEDDASYGFCKWKYQ